jgi:hypothetical protein
LFPEVRETTGRKSHVEMAGRGTERVVQLVQRTLGFRRPVSEKKGLFIVAAWKAGAGEATTFTVRLPAEGEGSV